MEVLYTVDVEYAGVGLGVMGHRVVVREMTSVVSFPIREGQSVTVGAQDVTV